MRRRQRKVLSSRAKRSHVSLTCQEGVVGVFLCADNFQNRLAQQIDSAAGFRRQPDLGDTIDGAAARLHSREVDLVAHDHPRQGRTKPGDDRGVSGMLGGARVGDNQSQIGALDFRPRSRDADLLDGVVRLAQACRIDDVQRNAIDLDAASDRIARCSGNGGHDRTILPDELIEQTGLASIGLSDQDNFDALEQQAPLTGTPEQAFERML